MTRAVRSRSTDDGPLRWLLITVSSAGSSSSLRVYVWRRLRSLGAYYLQQSVCLLPERPETTRAVRRLIDRVRREGGEARMLRIAIVAPEDERAIIEGFRAERSDEYAEVLARIPAFLKEIDSERAKGRTTYTEVEESEADLERLRTWLKRIQERDYFQAAGGDEAAAAVERCADALEAFEAEAFSAESVEDLPAATAVAAKPQKRRRAVGQD